MQQTNLNAMGTCGAAWVCHGLVEGGMCIDAIELKQKNEIKDSTWLPGIATVQFSSFQNEEGPSGVLSQMEAPSVPLTLHSTKRSHPGNNNTVLPQETHRGPQYLVS